MPSPRFQEAIKTILISSPRLEDAIKTIRIPSPRLQEAIKMILIPSPRLQEAIKMILIPSPRLQDAIKMILIPSPRVQEAIKTIWKPPRRIKGSCSKISFTSVNGFRAVKNKFDICRKIEMLKEGCVEACPGCSHRNLTLESSLDQKEKWLKKMLSPWEDKFGDVKSLADQERWNYRGKVCLNTRFFNGQWEFGMLKRDDFIDIPSCPVHSETVLLTISLLKDILPSADAFPMAFYYHAHSQVTLILKTKKFPEIDWLTEEVKKQLKDLGIEGLAIHLHPSAGRRLFDKYGWHQVYGRNFSFDAQGLIYGNTSFHQLISSLYNQSLDIAEAYFEPAMPIPVVDLYCGRGVSLHRWSKNKVPVIGIETGGEAVTCARINAPDATVLQGTCERRLPQLESWRLEQLNTPGYESFLLYTNKNPLNPPIGGLGYHSFLLYTNPPRTGMEPLVTDWIIKNLKPEKIAYLSCSAGTLRRDLDMITGGGYEVHSIIPFDFFPQTYHVESLVLLDKKT